MSSLIGGILFFVAVASLVLFNAPLTAYLIVAPVALAAGFALVRSGGVR